jgi:phosphatidylglycerophosphate synthase
MNREHTSSDEKQGNRVSLFHTIKKNYRKSLKPVQAEEMIGLVFVRPFSYLIALCAKALRMSPDMLSVIRGITALAGGILFFTGTRESLFAGSIIFFISNYFDSADGQLARICEKSTERGLILDGLGDGISIIGIYMGTAVALSRNNPGTAFCWWFLSAAAVLSFLFYIYTQGFLKYELFLYTTEDFPEPRDNFNELCKRLRSTTEWKKRIPLRFMILLTLGLETGSRLVLPGGYRGYVTWYKKDKTVPSEKKELFKARYKKNNGWILFLFNNLSIFSNQLIFILCGFFNRLDYALYIVLGACNTYFIMCVIIQRISFKKQLDALSSL